MTPMIVMMSPARAAAAAVVAVAVIKAPASRPGIVDFKTLQASTPRSPHATLHVLELLVLPWNCCTGIEEMFDGSRQ